MHTALITGGSAGLGLALTRDLATDGWHVVVDGRDAARLQQAVGALDGTITQVAGDVTDPAHRQALAAAVTATGRLDLLVHNASTLGPTPCQRSQTSTSTVSTTSGSPTSPRRLPSPNCCYRRCAPQGASWWGVSSDAAVEHYEGWGAYAASKAALDQVILTIGAENSEVAAYAVDPGEMRTAMHQAAFPGEDISDRPLPESVVPALRALLRQRPGNGRYRAADFAAPAEPLAATRRLQPTRRCRRDPALGCAAHRLRQPGRQHGTGSAGGARRGQGRGADAGRHGRGSRARALP